MIERPRKKKPMRTHNRLKIRDKAKPGGSKFAYEIRIVPCIDVPLMASYGNTYYAAIHGERYRDQIEFLKTVRSNLGRFKIVQRRHRNFIYTKVLLDSAGDVMFMAMAHPTSILRAYRYV